MPRTDPKATQQTSMELDRPQRQGELARRYGGSPFGLVGRMMADLDRWFGDPIGLGIRGDLWAPQLDVRERGGKLIVRADLPGLSPDDVKVDVDNDSITLRGERKLENEGEREGVYFSERSYGRFERAIPLPPGTDTNAIDARFANGVLEITAPLPKREPTGRSVEIKRGEAKKDPSKQH